MTVPSRGKPARIAIARTPKQIWRCHAVMRQLRPQFKTAQGFVGQVRRQQRQGYMLAFVETDRIVQAVAGYRYLESLFSGKFMYVDDLVTNEAARSQGFGGQLFDWLVRQAAGRGCVQLELDSGVQRFDAHRFYFRKRMKIASYHFFLKTKNLDSKSKQKEIAL